MLEYMLHAFTRALWLIILGSALASGNAGAFETQGPPWVVPTGGVPYCLEVVSKDATTTSEKDAFRSAAIAGIKSWESSSCADFCTQIDTSCTGPAVTANDGTNWIHWVSSWPHSDLVVGLTILTTVDGKRFDTDIFLNDVNPVWSTDGQGSTVDVQSVVVHEMGHALGLNHHDQTDTVKQDACANDPTPPSVMCGTFRGGQHRELLSDDVAGLCARYPVGSSRICSEPTTSRPSGSIPQDADDGGCACTGGTSTWYLAIFALLLHRRRV